MNIIWLLISYVFLFGTYSSPEFQCNCVASRTLIHYMQHTDHIKTAEPQHIFSGFILRIAVLRRCAE